MTNPLTLINRVQTLKRTGARLRKERAERRAARQTVAAKPTSRTGPEPLAYENDPSGFFRAFLRHRYGRDVRPFELWSKQDRLALAVLEHRRVACRSGHKTGKTVLASALAIWWALTRPNARVLMTAPTERQVKKALWGETRQFWANSPLLQEFMPEPALSPETGVRWKDGRELFGFTAKSADAVSGPGGPDVLVIIDESAGVPREVWEALQGVRAGGGKVLALANPTQTSGWFFDAFHDKRVGWHLEDISVTETPNFIEGREVIPGLSAREFEQEVRDDYGVDSPQYATRVLGKFPPNVGNAVIGFGLIEAARKAWALATGDEGDGLELGPTIDLGVDVARFGDDDSAIAARSGLALYSPAWFEKEHGIRPVVNGYDAVKVAGLAMACLRALDTKGKRIRIKVDCTGGYGEPVVSQLHALQSGGDLDADAQIVPINFSGESSDSEKYPVLRDELWFGARPWFREGGAMYPDPKLESELMAATYALDLKGRNKVEPKKEIKKRLGRSPDRADAALLAIYEPASAIDEMPPPGDEAERGFFDGYSGEAGFG